MFLRQRSKLTDTRSSSSNDSIEKSSASLSLDAPKNHGKYHKEQDSRVSFYLPSVAKSTLLGWDDISDWQRDNEYIISGYRQAVGSYRTCLASVFSIHNETVNIHSHLFGGLFFVFLPTYTYRSLYPQYETAGLVDIIVFAAFFTGVAACFFLSTIYHILSDHSHNIAAFGNQLDYLGIVLLMWGSTIPTVYYGFYKDEELQRLYWIIVSVLATICAIATLHPGFRTPAFRAYRASMYTALGLSGVIFVTHGILLNGWTQQKKSMSLDWMIVMGVLNLFGAAMYAIRLPERWYPEKYDIFGSSHQILHFMVIFAALAHMIGLFRAFEYAHGVRNA